MSQSKEPWFGKAASPWPAGAQSARRQAVLRKGGKWRPVAFLGIDSIRLADVPDAPVMTVRTRHFFCKTMGVYKVELRWTTHEGRKRKGVSVLRLYAS